MSALRVGEGQRAISLDSADLSDAKVSYAGTLQDRAPEINHRFGERVRDLREKRNLSLDEMAVRLMVPVSHLADIEAGRKSASIIDLESFAQQFRIAIAELLHGL